jgi:hypothetical protein
MKEVLITSKEWEAAILTYSSNEFNDLPELTLDYARSFLLLGGMY